MFAIFQTEAADSFIFCGCHLFSVFSVLREAAYGFEKWLITILPDDSIEEMENLHNMVERGGW